MNTSLRTSSGQHQNLSINNEAPAPAASEQASTPMMVQSASHYASMIGQHVQRSVASFCAYRAQKEVPIAWGKISLPNDEIRFRGSSASAKKILGALLTQFSQNDLNDASKELVLTHGYFRNYFQLKDTNHVTADQRAKSARYFSSMLDAAYPKITMSKPDLSDASVAWEKKDAVPILIAIRAREACSRPIDSIRCTLNSLRTVELRPKKETSFVLRNIQNGPIEYVHNTNSTVAGNQRGLFLSQKNISLHEQDYSLEDPENLTSDKFRNNEKSENVSDQKYSTRPISNLTSESESKNIHDSTKTAGLFISVGFSTVAFSSVGNATKTFFVPLEKIKTFCNSFGEDAIFQIEKIVQQDKA